ncbi:MAG: aldo/keto reductase [Armatimonadetes bacterium 55-13]|nr:aldo/keto reductase [Armatimonadota bacterium]OJU62170.1 MAG: aldo/keto reductase [Armatimonadetes bacterium 55-13]
MNYRELGRTGWNVSDVSFGAWAVGGTWGAVEDEESLAAMNRAVDLGVNFFDTADVYGDGRSERLIRQLKSQRSEEIHVATKAGRRLNPHVAEGYNKANLEAFIDRSRENLGMDTLDLVQLHCPPTPVYYEPEVFGALEDFVKAGKIRYWGVSVEKIEEGLKAMEYPNCQSIQIIFNIFRQRPAWLFLEEAKRRKVGVLARLPLSSGMLTGKMKPDTQFAADDHRAFNRDGAGFDKGETFSGVPYEIGLEAVEEIRPLVPEGWSMAAFALRWILMFDGVSCAIPGGKRPDQVESNCAASDLPPIPESTMAALRDLYERKIRTHVHDRW